MKILNLYAGIGGNRKLWEGHEITAIEYNEEVAQVYRDNFPGDTVIVADAHQYLLDHFKEFDFIWASPPCQSHSRMMKATRHNVIKFPDMKLYQEIIFLQHFFKGKWVVENVVPYYEPLIKETKKVGRHLFWANFEIKDFEIENIKGFITRESKKDLQEFKDFLGIQFENNIYLNGNHSPGQVLRNCVLPKTGKHILDCATGETKEKVETNTKQLQLL